MTNSEYVIRVKNCLNSLRDDLDEVGSKPCRYLALLLTRCLVELGRAEEGGLCAEGVNWINGAYKNVPMSLYGQMVDRPSCTCCTHLIVVRKLISRVINCDEFLRVPYNIKLNLKLVYGRLAAPDSNEFHLLKFDFFNEANVSSPQTQRNENQELLERVRAKRRELDAKACRALMLVPIKS